MKNITPNINELVGVNRQSSDLLGSKNKLAWKQALERAHLSFFGTALNNRNTTQADYSTAAINSELNKNMAPLNTGHQHGTKIVVAQENTMDVHKAEYPEGKSLGIGSRVTSVSQQSVGVFSNSAVNSVMNKAFITTSESNIAINDLSARMFKKFVPANNLHIAQGQDGIRVAIRVGGEEEVKKGRQALLALGHRLSQKGMAVASLKVNGQEIL